jgi:sortase A
VTSTTIDPTAAPGPGYRPGPGAPGAPPARPTGRARGAAGPPAPTRAADDTATIPVVAPARTTVPAPPSPSRHEAPPPKARRFDLVLIGASLSILGALLLGFVAELTVVGSIQHERDQQVLFDDYRLQLAEGVAPVGQLAEDLLVTPGSPVAILRVPAAGIDEVVVEGTTSSQTMSGPGHLRSTVLPGQAGTSVLMGRQAAYGGPFARIHELVPGDEIRVTTGQGEHTFSVTGVRRGGDVVTPVEPGKGRLTLVTADGPPYLARETVRVDADLTSQVQAAPPAVLSTGDLEPGELALQGDSSAWIPLVFWAQVLVLMAIAVVWAAFTWGGWQAWIVGVPTLAFLGLTVAGVAARLLPNLL